MTRAFVDAALAREDSDRVAREARASAAHFADLVAYHPDRAPSWLQPIPAPPPPAPPEVAPPPPPEVPAPLAPAPSDDDPIHAPHPIRRIQLVVAREFGVRRLDLISARRTADIVLPRQVAMWLCKTSTLKSLPEIGRRFGGRDHTTVLHALRKIEGMIAANPDFAARIERLRAEIARPA